MTHRMLALAAAVAGLAGCPSDSEDANPARLWIALRGSGETMVQLVPEEPDPF